MTTPPIDKAVVAAVDSGGTEAFLDLFVEDGAVDDWGSVYTGKRAIKQ